MHAQRIVLVEQCGGGIERSPGALDIAGEPLRSASLEQRPGLFGPAAANLPSRADPLDVTPDLDEGFGRGLPPRRSSVVVRVGRGREDA